MAGRSENDALADLYAGVNRAPGWATGEPPPAAPEVSLPSAQIIPFPRKPRAAST